MEEEEGMKPISSKKIIQHRTHWEMNKMDTHFTIPTKQ
jgi:hypothetical protein